ncbi:MAG: TonB-dependent receptor, partial [Bacteroidota bacterium]
FNDLIATPTFNSISNKIFEGSLTEDVQTENEEFEYNSKLVFTDFNIVGNYQPNSRNEFKFSALRSKSTLDYSSTFDLDEIEERSTQEHNVSSTGFNLSWTNRLSDRLSSSLSSSFTDYRMDYGLLFDIEIDEADEQFGESNTRNNELRNWETRLSFTNEITTNQILDFGYQLNVVNSFLEISFLSELEEDFSENIESSGVVNAGYASYFGKWDSGFQLGGGLRLNQYEALGEFRLDRHIRLNYELNNWLMLKSSAGVYHQYISSVKEVDFVFSNTIEQNWIAASENEEIPIISNQQFVVGALLNTGKWLIDLDIYRKKVFSLVSQNFGPSPESDEGALTGNEIINGIDFTVKRRWKYYRIWVNYSFQDSEVEAADQTFPSGLNIPHQVQFSQTLAWNRWQFSLGYTYRTGLAYTKATGFTEEQGDEEIFFEIQYEDINGSRLPDYHRLDFSTWYRLNKKTNAKVKGEIGISFLNLLNTQNLYSRTYDLDEIQEGVVVLEQIDRALLGFTPNLSLRLKFL